MILAFSWDRALEFAIDQARATGRRQRIRKHAVLVGGFTWWTVREVRA